MQDRLDYFICQVVGYKDSGKTTLITSLIKELTKAGMKVATLKNHGHGGEPASVRGTDTDRHMKAGAIVSAVKGENELQLVVKDTSEVPLEKILALYESFPIDYLIIEGYKRANFPKIVILNKEQDLELLDQVSNIIAIGVRDDRLLKKIPKSSLFTFSLNETYKHLPQLIECIKVNKDEGS